MLSLLNAYTLYTPALSPNLGTSQESKAGSQAAQAIGQNTPANTAASAQATQQNPTPYGRVITDTVELSPAAQKAAQQATQQTTLAATPARSAENAAQPSLYHERFYPVRSGFSAHTLAASVANPGAQPFSQNRPFAEVAAAARTSLDEAASALYPERANSTLGRTLPSSLALEDRNSLFAALDRRALFTVASNEGGLFSPTEQRYARDIMRQQQGNALGFASGPIAAGRDHSDPFFADTASRFQAGVAFLDAVSVEEQALDIEWATQRAANQRLYETETEKTGRTPENVSSPNPLVQLIQSILEQRAEDIDARRLNTQTFRPVLEGRENDVAAALEENRIFYGLL